MYRFSQFAVCMWSVVCVWETGDCAKFCQPVVKRLCPEGWFRFNMSCNVFTQCTEKSTCTADESARRCAAMGGHLASVRSDAESEFMLAMVDEHEGIIHIFLGGRDDVTSEGDWRWADGEGMEYENWATDKGEPNDHTAYGDGEDCIEINRWPGWDDRWNDITCLKQFWVIDSGYVCQLHL